MTDDIIEKCAGMMDRARCDGLKPAYWHMTQAKADELIAYGQFLGLPVKIVAGVPKGKSAPFLVASGQPDTTEDFLTQAAELIRQCTDADGIEEKLYADLQDWLRRYETKEAN